MHTNNRFNEECNEMQVKSDVNYYWACIFFSFSYFIDGICVFFFSFFSFYAQAKNSIKFFLAENKLRKNQQCLSDITFTPLSPMIYQYTKCAKCYFLMGCQIKSYSSAADRHYQCKDSGGGVTC